MHKFVGRENLVNELLERYFQISNQIVAKKNDIFVYNIWSSSGTGKTMLDANLLSKKFGPGITSIRYNATSDVDLDKSPARVLFRLRNELVKNFNVNFAEFDLALEAYKEEFGADGWILAEPKKGTAQKNALNLTVQVVDSLLPFGAVGVVRDVVDQVRTAKRDHADKNLIRENRMRFIGETDVYGTLIEKFVSDYTQFAKENLQPIIIDIDTFEDYSFDTEWLFSNQLGMIHLLPKTIWIIKGRDIVKELNSNNGWNELNSKIIELKNFSESETNDFLNQNSNITSADIRIDLFEKTGGHPLSLRLMTDFIEREEIRSVHDERLIAFDGLGTKDVIKRYVRYLVNDKNVLNQKRGDFDYSIVLKIVTAVRFWRREDCMVLAKHFSGLLKHPENFQQILEHIELRESITEMFEMPDGIRYYAVRKDVSEVLMNESNPNSRLHEELIGKDVKKIALAYIMSYSVPEKLPTFYKLQAIRLLGDLFSGDYATDTSRMTKLLHTLFKSSDWLYWSQNYLPFLAESHKRISKLYPDNPENKIVFKRLWNSYFPDAHVVYKRSIRRFESSGLSDSMFNSKLASIQDRIFKLRIGYPGNEKIPANKQANAILAIRELAEVKDIVSELWLPGYSRFLFVRPYYMGRNRQNNLISAYELPNAISSANSAQWDDLDRLVQQDNGYRPFFIKWHNQVLSGKVEKFYNVDTEKIEFSPIEKESGDFFEKSPEMWSKNLYNYDQTADFSKIYSEMQKNRNKSRYENWMSRINRLMDYTDELLMNGFVDEWKNRNSSTPSTPYAGINQLLSAIEREYSLRPQDNENGFFLSVYYQGFEFGFRFWTEYLLGQGIPATLVDTIAGQSRGWLDRKQDLENGLLDYVPVDNALLVFNFYRQQKGLSFLDTFDVMFREGMMVATMQIAKEIYDVNFLNVNALVFSELDEHTLFDRPDSDAEKLQMMDVFFNKWIVPLEDDFHFQQLKFFSLVHSIEINFEQAIHIPRDIREALARGREKWYDFLDEPNYITQSRNVSEYFQQRNLYPFKSY